MRGARTCEPRILRNTGVGFEASRIAVADEGERRPSDIPE
jgi:hypothetical protein